MLKATIILGLVGVAMALHETKGLPEQMVRIGSIGSSFANFKGMLVPMTDRMVDGIPSFELRTLVKGIPVMDDEIMKFRCRILEDFSLPLESEPKSVLMCRNMKWIRDFTTTDKKVFLFSAEDLKLLPGIKEIDLWLGRSMWMDLTSDFSLFRDDIKEQVLRIGSIGSHFTDLKGLLVPSKDRMIEGIPAFELRSMGMTLTDDELMGFRCRTVDDFFLPIETRTKPVVLCRNLDLTRGVSLTEKKVFLFSADELMMTPEMKMIDLWLGKTMLKTVV